jgi:molybdate transport system regulatory protein
MPTNIDKHRPVCRIWLEYDGKPLIGKGGAQILEAISEEKSISKAAKKTGMSYRYVWNYLAKIENALQNSIVETFRGGRKGGGGALLTKLGEDLLKEYRRVEGYVGEIIGDEEYWEAVGLKISARNRLRGIVQEVNKGVITAKIKIKLEKPAVVTAIISKEAVEELDIKTGDEVEAVIKATEVMVAKNPQS